MKSIKKIKEAEKILNSASLKQVNDPDSVVQALLDLEKLMRKRNSFDQGATSKETLANLSGSWRLIFTTGTISMTHTEGRNVLYVVVELSQIFKSN